MNNLVVNDKYFAIACIKTWVSENFPDVLPLNETIIVTKTLPFKVDDFWKESIGSANAENIEECNLYLFAFSDEYNSEPYLKKRLWSLYYGLLLQNVGYTNNFITIGGSVFNNEFSMGSLTDTNYYVAPPKVLPKNVEIEDLRTAYLIANGIDKIYSNTIADKFLRIRKGFGSLLNGIKETQFQSERLHHFVRGLEGIIKPEISKTKKQFKHRCKLFSKGSKLDDILDEIFDMRSYAEHLNPIREVLEKKGYNQYDFPNLMSLRTYQAELLASFAYRQMFMNASLLDYFETDFTISEFWKKPDDEIKPLWEKPIELEMKSNERFRNYLD